MTGSTLMESRILDELVLCLYIFCGTSLSPLYLNQNTNTVATGNNKRSGTY